MDYKDISNKSEYLKFKKKVITNLEKFIDNEMNDNYKKSVLITYWINEFTKYLNQEKTFNPNYLPVYEKGSVVQANLGFNVGSEEGGLHYAIVLNKNDNKDNPILTIVPISSVKPNKKWYSTDVDLGNEIYNLIYTKTNALIKNAENTTNLINEIVSNDSNCDIDRLEVLQKSAENDIKTAENCIAKIEGLKKGSYAICNQITTISKIRIKDPIKPNSPMYNIVVSNNYVKMIDKTLKNNFL